MDKLHLREVILVEGRCDKAALSQVTDALILTTQGFGIFKDRERADLFRRLARERGVIVLTDSDGAGLVIRGHLKGILPPDRVKMAYIPEIPGKEPRKRRPGKEGKLGVEGMTPQVLREALLRAGATQTQPSAPRFTKADLFALGLSGTPDAACRRRRLQAALDLPKDLSANALLQVLNALAGPEGSEVLPDWLLPPQTHTL